jgi:hypothetical protein
MSERKRLTAEDAEGTEEEHERKKKHPPRVSVTGVLRDYA